MSTFTLSEGFQMLGTGICIGAGAVNAAIGNPGAFAFCMAAAAIMIASILLQRSASA